MGVKRWVFVCGILVGCGGPEKRPAELALSGAPVAMCAERVWNAPWSEPDSCTTCVQEVEACVGRFGQTYCAQACDACLGENACQDSANVALAAQHVKASQMVGGTSLWAFQGAVDSRLVAQDGYYLASASDGMVVGNVHGVVWRLPEGKCEAPVLDVPWVHRVCGEVVERYEVGSGFRGGDVKLPVAVQELEGSNRFRGPVSLDVPGQQMLVRTKSGATIFENGKVVLTHPGAVDVVRIGPTWKDRTVLFEDRWERYANGALVETVALAPTQPMRSAVANRRFVRVQGEQISEYLDLWTGVRTAVADDEEWWLAPDAVLKRTYQRGDVFEQIAPRSANFSGFPKLWSGHFVGLRWDAEDRLFGSLLAWDGGESNISFDVEVMDDAFVTGSSRHGAPVWVAPVRGQNAVWVGSVDGLVQRWDFDTGSAIRAEIPYRFAVGGAHALGSHGLVLREHIVFEGETSRPARAVMIYQPDNEPVVVEFKEAIVDAVLADGNTLVVATPDAIVWWDVEGKREIRREPGTGRFSEDGSTVVIYEAQTMMNTKPPGPARILRTRGDGKDITTEPVRGCAIAADGDEVMCFEVKGQGSAGKYRFYDTMTGKMTEELDGMLSGEIGQLSPDGDGFLFGGTFHRNWQSVETFGGDRRSVGPGGTFWGFMDDGRVVVTQGDRLMLAR